MGQHHNHHQDKLRGKKLLWVALLNFSITLVQIVGGLLSNSLSLLSDALHNLGDSSAIFIAFVAGKKSRKRADEHRTFGYQRVEILAALFNAVVLIAISVFLFFEAYHRFVSPEPIKGKMMLIVASFGLLANLISVYVLNKDKNFSLNIRAAYLHLLGDTLSSVAVIVGAIAIWLYDWIWLDPLITVIVGLYIIYHTWGIVQQTLDILMQSTPENIDLIEIQKQVEGLKEIRDMHHVHLWKLDDKQIHIEAHLNLRDNVSMLEMMEIRKEVEHLLREKFHISHITLQMGYECCTDHAALIHQEL